MAYWRKRKKSTSLAHGKLHRGKQKVGGNTYILRKSGLARLNSPEKKNIQSIY